MEKTVSLFKSRRLVTGIELGLVTLMSTALIFIDGEKGTSVFLQVTKGCDGDDPQNTERE